MVKQNLYAQQGMFPNVRLRRLRGHAQMRRLLRETSLSPQDVILPLFIHHGQNVKQPIASMPGHYQLSLDHLRQEIDDIKALSISGVILFGIPAEKDDTGSASYCHDGIIQQAIRLFKAQAPEILVIADSCLCEYTSHGHCGLVKQQQDTFRVDNDETLAVLQQQVVSYAQAGVDIIAPSGMMDGMVLAIRQALDKENFHHIPILSYAVKYQSALYGPFREAADGAPQFGDRSSYQMDWANKQEALREAQLDVAEGADMLMVKPASHYLDIICRVKQQLPHLPLGAYHVSGEYAMIKAAVEKGWLAERETVVELLTGIKRAGADFIITYYAKSLCQWLS